MIQMEKLITHLRLAVSKKWDGVIITDGMEGSGKTSLAIYIAHKLDPTINLNRIVFTPEQFFEAVDNAQIGEAIVWDEFVTAGLSNDFFEEAQRTLIKKMVMIRKKNLYIIWVMPYFFMLGRYFAVARSRFLMHSYTPDGIERGYWKAWNYDRKRKMYFRGKKEFDYCIDPYLTGTFEDFFTTHPDIINIEEYEKKKEEASYNIDKKGKKDNKEEESKIVIKYRTALNNLIESCRTDKKYTLHELADITKISISGIMYYKGGKT